jgi:virginiamycin B lyase
MIGRIAMDGTVAEFPLPTTCGAGDIAAGPDGNLWFTEEGGNRIGRIVP